MSLRAAYHRAICRMVREGRRDVLARLVREGQAVEQAYEVGGVEAGREAMRDLEARAILRQAFPDWEWRE